MFTTTHNETGGIQMINVKSLKSASFIKTFNASTVLVSSGDSSDKMYIVIKGSAIIYENYRTPKQHITGELNPGDFFGEMALFLNKPGTDTIVSIGELKAMEISRSNIYQFFQNDPEAAYLITQKICQKLDNLSNTYANQKTDSPAEKPQAVSPAVKAQEKPQASGPAAKPQEKPQADSPAAKAQEKPKPQPEPKPQAEAAAQPKPQTASKKISKAGKAPVSSLFPSGHKHYELPEFKQKEELFLEGTLTCPMCGRVFEFPHVRTVLIRTISTDHDLRKTHDGINLTHYLTATCPECLFSAITDKFNEASKVKKERVQEITDVYKKELGLTFEEMDANTIFARLYLSLAFTLLCYDNAEMLDARLWMNISWLYRDCGDLEMEKYAMEQALKAYDKSYQTLKLNAKTEQSVLLMIAELNYRLGNEEEAKKYFFMTKSKKTGNLDVENFAEDRLYEIK